MLACFLDKGASSFRQPPGKDLMTTRQFLILIALLMLPCAYQRTMFKLNRLAFYDTPLREKSGLNIHHGHFGVPMAFVGTLLLAFGVRDLLSLGLSSFGWGLMLDEIVPMLKMKSKDRTSELDVYAKSRNATFVLIGAVVAVVSLLSWYFH